VAAYFIHSAMKGPSLIFRVNLRLRRSTWRKLSNISNQLDLPFYACGSCTVQIETVSACVVDNVTCGRDHIVGWCQC